MNFNKRNKLLIPVVIPLILELIIIVVHYYIHLEIINLVFIALLAVFIPVFIEVLLVNYEYHTYAKNLRHLVPIVPLQLRDYVNISLRDKINTMIELSSGKSAVCSFSEQIQIATSLSLNVKERFWATSTDIPSKLWEEGRQYFDVLQKMDIKQSFIDSLPNKARLVILKLNDLEQDYQTEKFQQYVKWHKDNGFELKFYLVPNDEYIQNKLLRQINHPLDNPLVDFMLKDHDFIYGRIRYIGNKVETMYIEKNENSLIDRFNMYTSFFKTTWEDAETVNSLMAKIELKKNSLKYQSISMNDYKADFLGLNGLTLFTKIVERIGAANTYLYAMDVADKKDGGINLWGGVKVEYNDFLEASIKAAVNGADVKRIYIRNVSTIIDQFSLHAFRRQLEAGIQLIFIDYQEADSKNLFLSDYIITDNFGFKLAEDEEFDKIKVEIGKNLIIKAQIEEYKQLFVEAFEAAQPHEKFVGLDSYPNLIKFIS